MPSSTSAADTPVVTTVPSRRRAAVRLLAGVTAGLLLALPMTNVGAVRHIRLVSSSPAKDAHVMAPLREIRLTFSGKIAVSTASVQLLAADSTRVKVGALTAVPDSERVAVAKVSEPLKNGTYTVQWKAIAADGAAGSGSYSFMYMAAKK
ncbi:MAG: copper resistance protein CopC [Gemmatimonadaceae bacterium]|jgi:copper resistance protein C|uniref:copper resistance CopC family protein n=1 Tax=Gemmatimonas sp. UBA7669 TaxID=1946568 RepID=UPI0025BD6DEC|nr:copper resistance CopC family protein [Gemmatimonas sp. UBA7669]MBX9854827.1 copper resistance protein CopC [Gemmatimonadaceae bacterium]